MMRVAMRGFLIVLAMVLVAATAGTVLCEMDCAAGGHAESVAAMTPMNAGASHCDGEQMDSAQRDMGAHHGSSNGNRKHGAHLHTGIVATVGARVLISPSIKFCEFVASVDLCAQVFARSDENFWKNNSSPPINSSFVFAAGVLRI